MATNATQGQWINGPMEQTNTFSIAEQVNLRIKTKENQIWRAIAAFCQMSCFSICPCCTSLIRKAYAQLELKWPRWKLAGFSHHSMPRCQTQGQPNARAPEATSWLGPESGVMIVMIKS